MVYLYVSSFLVWQPWATIYNNNDPTQTEKNIWINMNCGANGQGNTTPDPTNINVCPGGDALNIDLNTGNKIPSIYDLITAFV